MPSFLYELPYNIYILLFGVYVSVRITCGGLNARQLRLLCAACPALLLLQGALMYLFDVQTVRLLYPLVTHLPLAAALILCEKCRWDITATAIAISYSMCQLPRWIGLLLSIAALSPAAHAVIHLVCSHLLLLFLDRFCLSAIHDAIHGPRYLLASLGAPSILYYFYEYAMLYTRSRYLHLQFLSELLPTALVTFFILFVVLYQQETKKRMQAEQQMHAFELSLLHAEQEMHSLRIVEEQTAILRHDMRHHLMAITAHLHAGKPDSALQYILDTQQSIDSITPMHFCSHKTVDLLLGAFQNKADAQRSTLRIKADLPQNLEISDAELCAMLSNGLENALAAVKKLPQEADRTVDVFFGVRQSTLLLEIKNPYQGEIVFKNELPHVCDGKNHYGCFSIRSIAVNRQGFCSFSTENNRFVLRVAIPLKSHAAH